MRSYNSLIALFLVVSAWAAPGYALDLVPGAPERYTIREGDTLWGIASQYLERPWEWAELWQANPQIENPDQLYAGDVLILSGNELRALRSHKLDTLRLTPVAFAKPLRGAITSVPPSAILPFLSGPLVVDLRSIDDSPHILIGFDDHTYIGNWDNFFARNLTDPEQKFYDIYRLGDAFVDPETKEELGQEALFLGHAKLLEFAEISTLAVTRAVADIRQGDRLLPSEDGIVVPTFHPRRPPAGVQGRIIRVYGSDPWLPGTRFRGDSLSRAVTGSVIDQALGGIQELGTFNIATLNLGERDGIEPGHVLRVLRDTGPRRDPVDRKLYDLPRYDSGLMMVFRVFPKVSYALVVKGNRAMNLLDAVETP